MPHRVIIYPHLPFQYEDGGIVVQYYLAACLQKRGVDVSIYPVYGMEYNTIFDRYCHPDEIIDDSTIVLYCEGVIGNPLHAKRVVRWMLSELGQNVSYDTWLTWNPNELVYFYGCEVRFRNILFFENYVYKRLQVVRIPPQIRPYTSNTLQRRQSRCGQCYTRRKQYQIHGNRELPSLHEATATELGRELSIQTLLDIFHKKELFISYDPITYLIIISALCGCPAVVYPIEGCTKLQWLQKTHFWDYLCHTGEELYGVAYGIEERSFAESTLHLVYDQQTRINEYVEQTTITTFLRDLENFENCQNTVKHVYGLDLTLLPFSTQELPNISMTERFNTLHGRLFIAPTTASSPKIIIPHPKGHIELVSDGPLSVLLQFFTTPIDQNKHVFHSFELDSSLLFQILWLKEQQWTHGLQSQYEFFMKYYLHPHDHVLFFEHSRLISYAVVKKYKHDSTHKIYIIDTIIVDQEYRGKGYGRQLLDYILHFYEPDTDFLLISDISTCDFYTRAGFKRSLCRFVDKPLTSTQVVLHFSRTDNDLNATTLSYLNEKLVHHDILGGVTMVHVPHLIFLTNYIFQNKCTTFVEVGVAKGGVLAVAALANPDMKIFGFDSWSGMPSLTEYDDHQHKQYEGMVWSQISDVYDTFDFMNAPMQNVTLIKGYVQDTFPTIRHQIGSSIDILRLDVDWYEATDYCLRHFYDLVISGGLVIIDDYYYNKGCQKAVDDFRTEHNIQDPLYHFVGDIVFWVKST